MWTPNSAAFCKSLGIEVAIIQAPMANGPTTPALVAASANAGALGSFAAGYMSAESLQSAIREIRRQTERPFCVNVFSGGADDEKQPGDAAIARLREIAGAAGVSLPDLPLVTSPLPDVLGAQIEVICQEKVPIVSTTFGSLPPHEKDRLQSGGAYLIATATCIKEAVAIHEAGYEAVVAQGSEAGGHRGSFTTVAGDPPLVGLMALLPQITDAVPIPVIAAGGIMDGRGIVAALALGAGAVQMGTAFLTMTESGADDVWVQTLLSDPRLSTVLTKSFTGKLARAVRNSFTDATAPCDHESASYPLQMHLTEAIRSAAKAQGNLDFLPLWAGQGARLARRTDAAALTRALCAEVEDCLARFTIDGKLG